MLNTRPARADTEPINILSDVAFSSTQHCHPLVRTQSQYCHQLVQTQSQHWRKLDGKHDDRNMKTLPTQAKDAAVPWTSF